MELKHPTDKRCFALAVALERNYTVQRLHDFTRIDHWFLYKLRSIIWMQKSLRVRPSLAAVGRDEMRILKQAGFSDAQIGRCLPGNVGELHVRQHRINSLGVVPVVKQIDTLAAEFPAQTNYLYVTYLGTSSDVEFAQEPGEGGTMVLGCGAYRIGSSCEFDWCAVSCLRTLRKLGRKSIMINYNPETVSTDYDESDRLYFEELSLERVMDVYDLENSAGVIVSVGGQIPNTLCLPLAALNVNILGTTPEAIDLCEDRSKFSAMLDALEIDQPEWAQLTSAEEAERFAQSVGYPVLVRPSYVLSGAAMRVSSDATSLRSYLDAAAVMSADHPVVISKFIQNAKEIEYDGIACDGKIINYAISEHVENAGVHSGDATLLLPAQKLYQETLNRVKKVAGAIAMTLSITGPFNIQFLSKNNQLRVIECNLRSSRSFPFVSKTLGVNLVELATRAMCGAPVRSVNVDLMEAQYVVCKAPMFSFTRLQGADPRLRVEMTSTGEVAAFASDPTRAYLMALLSTNFRLPKKNGHILVSVGSLSHKVELLHAVQELIRLGYQLYGSTGSASFFGSRGLEMKSLVMPLDADKHPDQPNITDYLKEGKLDLVINIPRAGDDRNLSNGYQIRRTAVDFNISLVSNVKCAIQLTNALSLMATPGYKHEVLSCQDFKSGDFVAKKAVYKSFNNATMSTRLNQSFRMSFTGAMSRGSTASFYKGVPSSFSSRAMQLAPPDFS
jgi:carbamoyl-phosphate synthase large subunit